MEDVQKPQPRPRKRDAGHSDAEVRTISEEAQEALRLTRRKSTPTGSRRRGRTSAWRLLAEDEVCPTKEP